MPTVPRYNNPTVNTQAMPGVRVNTSAPIEAFGGGASSERVTQASNQLMEVGQKIFLQEKEKADDLATIEANTKLIQEKNRLMYDPKEGVINKKGKNAFGALEEYGGHYQKFNDDIEESLANDEQKAMFRKIRMQHETDFTADLQRHTGVETKRFEDEVFKSGLATYEEDAILNYQNSGKVASNLAMQKSLLQEYAANNGQSSEWVDHAIKEAHSATHKGVINRMLANNQDLHAKSYFQANKDGISGTDVGTLEKALEEGSLRGESQRFADSMWDNSKEDFAKAMEMAGKIKDPEVRDSTESRLRQKLSDYKVAFKETQDRNYLEASALLKSDPGRKARDVITPELWTKLTLSQQKTLSSYNSDPVNNDKAWVDFFFMNERELAALSQADFEEKFYSRFDKDHKTRAENLYRQAVKSKENKEDNFEGSSTLSFKDQIRNTIQLSGLIDADTKPSEYSKEEAALVARFEEKASREIASVEQGQTKKLSGQERQDIIKRIAGETVIKSRLGWFDKETPLLKIKEDEVGKTYVPVEKIPADQLTRMKNYLKSIKRPATNDKLQRAYPYLLLKDDEKALAILRE